MGKVRRFLDVLTGLMVLLALGVAAVGHFLPWFRLWSATSLPPEHMTLVDYQEWHAIRSGIALGTATFLVIVSLFDIPLFLRKLVVLLIFLSLLTAICFQVLWNTPYHISEAHAAFVDVSLREDAGFLVSLIATSVAAVLTVFRMAWTFTATRLPPVPR